MTSDKKQEEKPEKRAEGALEEGAEARREAAAEAGATSAGSAASGDSAPSGESPEAPGSAASAESAEDANDVESPGDAEHPEEHGGAEESETAAGGAEGTAGGASTVSAASIVSAASAGSPDAAPPSFRPVSAGSPVSPGSPAGPASPSSPATAQEAPDAVAPVAEPKKGLIRRASSKKDEVVTIKVREIFDIVDAREAQAEAERLAAERAAAHPSWTGQDFVWWNTAAVLTAARAGRRPNPVSPIIDPVRSSFGSGECMLASCDAELLMWRRGDATYTPSRGFFLAGGPVGLALTAAFFSGQAVVNKKRRRAAAADAVEKWRHLANARLTVSTHGIYIGTGEGIMPVGYHEVQEVASTGPGEIVMAASNAKGTARWKLRGQWAELVLVLWSVLYMPEHPQVVGRTWLPQGWLDHAAANGYPVDTSTWPRFTPNPDPPSLP